MNFVEELRHFFGGRTSEYEETETFEIPAEYEIIENIYQDPPLSYNQAILETILFVRDMDLENLLVKRDRNIILHGNLVISDFLSVKNLYVMGEVENNGLCIADNVSSLNVNSNVDKLREMFYHHIYNRAWTDLLEYTDDYTENDNVELTNMIIDVLFEVIDNFRGVDSPEIIAFIRKVLDESEKYKKK